MACYVHLEGSFGKETNRGKTTESITEMTLLVASEKKIQLEKRGRKRKGFFLRGRIVVTRISRKKKKQFGRKERGIHSPWGKK